MPVRGTANEARNSEVLNSEHAGVSGRASFDYVHRQATDGLGPCGLGVAELLERIRFREWVRVNLPVGEHSPNAKVFARTCGHCRGRAGPAGRASDRCGGGCREGCGSQEHAAGGKCPPAGCAGQLQDVRRQIRWCRPRRADTPGAIVNCGNGAGVLPKSRAS